MAEITWKSILTKLVAGNHLSAGEAWWFVDDLMKGNANPAAVGAVLAAQQLLGLTAEELAFYDALTKPQAIKDFYEHDELIAITKELTDLLRKNRTIDWQKRWRARNYCAFSCFSILYAV